MQLLMYHDHALCPIARGQDFNGTIETIHRWQQLTNNICYYYFPQIVFLTLMTPPHVLHVGL